MVGQNEIVYLAISVAAVIAMAYVVYSALRLRGFLSEFLGGEVVERITALGYMLLLFFAGYIIMPIAMIPLFPRHDLHDYVFIIAAISFFLIALSYILAVRILAPMISLIAKPMIGMQWSELLSTQVDEIDNQHKELFSRTSRLFDAVIEGKGEQEISKIIEFLGGYVVMHFGTEEKYMTQHNYLGYSSHKAEHEKFIQDFSNFKKRYESEGASSRLTLDTLRTVVDWLINHIGKVDKAMGAFLKTRM